GGEGTAARRAARLARRKEDRGPIQSQGQRGTPARRDRAAASLAAGWLYVCEKREGGAGARPPRALWTGSPVAPPPPRGSPFEDRARGGVPTTRPCSSRLAF